MKKKEKTEIKIKTQKSKKIQKPKKFKTQKENKNKNKPKKLFFNLTLSLPLTFRVSLFLPHSLLSSSHLESFSSLSILAFRPQIGVLQISMEALGRWDSDSVVRCLLMGSRGSPWVRWSWLAVVVARHGWSWLAVGRLDLMGWLGWIQWWLGWLWWLLGWFSWWVCGLVELKGMDLGSCVGL